MSLFGAMGVGITGVTAQSTKIGTISDNIANIDTIGYKSNVSRFGDLIANETASLYSNQGVAARAVAQISHQGLLQASESSTDIAIYGEGFFVVNTLGNGSGSTLYTRAGQFKPDDNGDYRNAAGYYLQAWALDVNGDVVNPGTLQTVNVDNLSSDAVATNNVSIGANLNASQTVLTGAGLTVKMSQSDTVNDDITADQLIIPTTLNGITRGNLFTVTTGTGGAHSYTYGGFSMGRNVTDASSTGNGDSATNVLTSPVSLASNPLQSVGGGSSDVIVTVPSTTGLSVGSVVALSGATALGGITAGQLNTSFVIQQIVDGTHYRITTAGTDSTVGGTTGGGGSVSEGVRRYAGAIFDANSAGEAFFSGTDTSTIRPESLSFTITTAATGTLTFTYHAGAANPLLGQFNSLNTLATAINNNAGLQARVVNGRLYVGATDSNAAVTFANGQAAASSGPPVQYGLDWVGELGLANVASGTDRFANYATLSSDINSSGVIQSAVSNPLGNASMSINVIDPTDTIAFNGGILSTSVSLPGGAYTTTAGSNVVTIRSTLTNLSPGDTVTLSGLPLGTYDGIASTDLNGSFVVQSVGAGTFTILTAATASSVTAGSFGFGSESLHKSGNVNLSAAYSPTSSTANMAGRAVVPQFSRSVTVYDSLGAEHDLTIGFVKLDTNTWAAEIYGDPTDVTSPAGGQIGHGTMVFNGDGSLASVSASLTSALPITWSDAAADPSSITFDWGTAGAVNVGQTDGMRQFTSAYDTDFIHQNGVPLGTLSNVSINDNGDVIAHYTNGHSASLYRIALAKFISPDNLTSLSGNVFAESDASGAASLNAAKQGGAGVIASSQLESSNADLGTQLSDMIVAQRAYQFNTKLISTTDNILQTLVDMV